MIVFERPEDCAECSGTGAEGGNAGLVTCARCNGEGVIRKKAGFLSSRRDCMGCGGTGQVPRVRCANCEGAGLVDRERRYTVRIPPGSTGGSTQRVPREGGPGRRGGPPGDLHVIVRVRPHPFFARETTREGDVLVIDVPLSPVEAALGAEIDVPVLDGRVRMRVPAGTQAGTQFRLRGKGFPRSAGARGDAHVRVAIETPAVAVGRREGAVREAGRGAGRRGDAEAARVPRRRPRRQAGGVVSRDDEGRRPRPRRRRRRASRACCCTSGCSWRRS